MFEVNNRKVYLFQVNNTDNRPKSLWLAKFEQNSCLVFHIDFEHVIACLENQTESTKV